SASFSDVCGVDWCPCLCRAYVMLRCASSGPGGAEPGREDVDRNGHSLSRCRSELCGEAGFRGSKVCDVAAAAGEATSGSALEFTCERLSQHGSDRSRAV